MIPQRVLITGAAGKIGATLRTGLRGQFPTLHLTDSRELGAAGLGEEVMQADLTDFAAMLRVMQGVNTVIHLGGIPDEHTYEQIRAVNMDGTYNVMEAARQAGVKRVIFASSIHAVGFYPRSVMVSPDLPARPDTYYGVSKVFGESLGQLYFERYGLEFVAVRICSFETQPQNRRHLSTWLSPRDAVQLFGKAATAPETGYLTVAGISGNTRRWMTTDGWEVLGYAPQDNAEAYAAQVEAVHGHPEEISEQRQGGVFTDPAYQGRAGK